jgi:hypothetical protein
MQRIQNAGYQHARQACYLCLNNHDGVDTEVQIDYEGVLFLCRGCCGHLAQTAGFRVDDDRQPEIDKLKSNLETASAQLADAEHRLEQIRLYDTKVDNLAKGRAKRAEAKAGA